MNHTLRRFVAATVLLGVALVAVAPAQGKPRKPPKYRAAISVTTHSRVFIGCDYGWTADWVFSGTYTATPINSLSTLDAVTRTGSGTLQWSDDAGCTPSPRSGSCPLGVESPIPGAAGYEDAYIVKAPGGFRVEFQGDIAVVQVGDAECHGAFWGPNGEYIGGFREYVEPQAFIPANRIGRKTITAPIAGSIHAADAGRNEDAQMNGTLTLTRKGKR
jgi:hypothetical protein